MYRIELICDRYTMGQGFDTTNCVLDSFTSDTLNLSIDDILTNAGYDFNGADGDGYRLALHAYNDSGDLVAADIDTVFIGLV